MIFVHFFFFSCLRAAEDKAHPNCFRLCCSARADPARQETKYILSTSTWPFLSCFNMLFKCMQPQHACPRSARPSDTGKRAELFLFKNKTWTCFSFGSAE